MTLRDARAITDFWQECPPENEMLAMFARVYTSWEPASILNMTEEERMVEHRKSLQRRWDAGALSAQDLVRGGGLISAGPN